MLRVPRLILARSLVRRFAVSAPALPSVEVVKTWDTAGVVEFARTAGLGAAATEVLEKNEINGEDLLTLTEDKLVRANMPLGPANRLAASIAERRNTHETVTLMLKYGGNGKRGVIMPYTFASNEHFAKFAATHDIFVSNQGGTKKQPVMTLSDAQNLADGDFLMLSAPFDVLEERIGTLDDHVKSGSDGQEFATTQAIVRCATMRKEFGELRVINDGYPVTFYDDDRTKILQADGLVINSVVLLLNEVKHKPSMKEAIEQQSRARLLESILSSSSASTSVPPHILPELKRAGVTSVRPVLSGYNFAPHVEKECEKQGVLIMKTNGTEYSNPA